MLVCSWVNILKVVSQVYVTVIAKVLYDDRTLTGNSGRPPKGQEPVLAARHEAHLLLNDPLGSLILWGDSS